MTNVTDRSLPCQPVYRLLVPVLLALVSSSARAQDDLLPDAGTVPRVSDLEKGSGNSTRELNKRFDRAQKLLSEDNYAEAARLLQAILDSDEDSFLKTEGPADSAEQSLKVKSQQLLGQMPAEGRTAYEQQQGPAARRLLDEALKSHNMAAVSLVARRYFHTQAGHEAVYVLAADHFDHDRPLLAAVAYERLLTAPGSIERWQPYLSLRCAASWLRAGLTDKAVAVVTELQRRSPKKSITLAGRDVELFEDPAQALSWLGTATGSLPAAGSAGIRDWATLGGDPARNGSSSGGSPYLNRGWRTSTVEGATEFQEYDTLLAKTFDSRRQAAAASEEETVGPSLSSLQPLIVGNLVIVRGIGDVRAYDALSGKLVWATGEKDQTLLEVLQQGGGIQVPQAQISGNTLAAFLVASRAWDDATFGTLSSDGELVFVIEDLPLNPLLVDQNGPRRGQGVNRLAAYDVKTGRAVWELGGAGTSGDDPWAGVYFLGAPLPLDRRLYALIETGGDIRLAVIDPHTGRQDWQQTLTTPTPTDLPAAMLRRQSGLTPSFAADILVCPIGSEQVVALSLSQRTLLWRYRLQQPAELYEPPIRRRFGQRPNFIRMPSESGQDQNSWLDSYAILADLKVIVTPRGSDELYCLNLQDGSLVWKKPRGEGLFVAGVHRGHVLVVGRSFVSALKLADGEPAWSHPAGIPVPSGRGFVAGDYLYVPLTTAEVAVISLQDGRIVARARSLTGNVPGNLAAVQGTIVSQGGDFVEAYRQLDALEAEIAAQLTSNPDDPQALALRGEIQLQRGKTENAYADLKRALELKSDDDTIRGLLVGSLLEGLRVDFPAYRALDAEIAALATSDADRSTYLWLRAQGLQRTGEQAGALETLLKFGDPRVADQELERIDASLVTRRDRLVRARAADILAQAPAPLRADAARVVGTQAVALRDRHNNGGLRRLASYFGGALPEAEIDKSQVALSADADWLAVEFSLADIVRRGQPDAAPLAQARLVQLYLGAERPREALAAAQELARTWPEAPALDGKTGRALAAEWASRSDLAREAELEAPWPTGLVESERLGAVGPAATRQFDIPLIGDHGLAFHDTIVQIGSNWRDISARDSLGRVLWKFPLDFPVNQGRPMLNRAYAAGHLLLLSIGTEILAIDVLGNADIPGPRLAWNFSLRSAGTAAAMPQRRQELNTRRRFVYNELGELAGTIGPVTSEQITVLAGRKLVALDPLTGKTLWSREGIRPGTELFGDERLIFAAAPDSGRANVFDAVDGNLLGERSLPPASKRLEMIGSHIITWKTKNERQILSRFDPWAGQDLWSRDFEDTAQVTMVDTDEAAVLELSGKLTILSLRDGAVRFEAATEPEPELRQLHVIRSRQRYVVIANQPPELGGWQQVTPQTIPVHGRVYGFDRQTGQRLWVTEIHRQGLDLNQPAELPVLTFLSNYTLPRKNQPGMINHAGLTCLDTRTGRLVFDQREFDEPLLFVEYLADPALKQLDLRLFRSVLRLSFTDKPLPPPE